MPESGRSNRNAGSRLAAAAKVEPLGFEQPPTDEPFVLAWMPAASLYFVTQTAI